MAPLQKFPLLLQYYKSDRLFMFFLLPPQEYATPGLGRHTISCNYVTPDLWLVQSNENTPTTSSSSPTTALLETHTFSRPPTPKNNSPAPNFGYPYNYYSNVTDDRILFYCISVVIVVVVFLSPFLLTPPMTTLDPETTVKNSLHPKIILMKTAKIILMPVTPSPPPRHCHQQWQIWRKWCQQRSRDWLHWIWQ